MLSDNPRVRANQLARREKLCVTLESGNYDQTTGVLRSNPGNKCCCLGVAADIVAPSQWYKRFGGSANSWYHNSDDKMPGKHVKKLYGFSDDQANELARCNDRWMSFPAIAAMIRGMP